MAFVSIETYLNKKNIYCYSYAENDLQALVIPSRNIEIKSKNSKLSKYSTISINSKCKHILHGSLSRKFNIGLIRKLIGEKLEIDENYINNYDPDDIDWGDYV
jgi:hypothetical protein